jgi:hypothetical protein
MDRITSNNKSGARYMSLRIIGALFTLIGTVLLLVGTLVLVFGVYTLLAGTTDQPPQGAGPFATRPVGGLPFGLGLSATLALLWSLGILLSGLQLVALGALFRLFIHLESNTWESAQSLERIRMRLESRGESVEAFFRS